MLEIGSSIFNLFFKREKTNVASRASPSIPRTFFGFFLARDDEVSPLLEGKFIHTEH